MDTEVPADDVDVTYGSPPPHWEPLDVTRTLLDIIYWANRAKPQRPSTGWGLGMASATRGKLVVRPDGAPAFAPSTSAAVQELVSSVTYTAELPIATVSAPVVADPLMVSIIERTVNNISTVRSDPPASIPISTVFHENTQLRWDDAEHLCDSGADCAAWHLEGAPGPLPVYVAPGTDRSTVPAPAFCLLCIRADASSVCRIAMHVGKATPYSFGMTPCVLPPFQNLVDCADGYHSEVLGVTPGQDIMSPISIASASFPMTVCYDALAEQFYVDQSAGIWRPDKPPLLN